MNRGQKSKSIKVFLTAIIIVTVLSACNKNNSDNSQETDAAVDSGIMAKFDGELEQNVVIRVLENDTAIEQGYFAELLKSFNEAYAEYNIVAEDAKVDQYMDLANDGPYGYGPDVLYQANDMLMKNVEGKHILPLPVEKLESYDQIPQTAWDAYKTEINGSPYYCAVPVNVQALMLYYRKDLLPENWETEWDSNQNQVPDMLESFPSLYQYSKLLHEADSSKYGFMESLYEVYFSGGYLFTYGGYIFGKNNTDASDIGLSKGEAEKGVQVVRQLASIMNEECIDDTIKKNSYSKLASGEYFATISTPDVYTLFLNELIKAYEKDGMSNEDAQELAAKNLVITEVPALPESGDLTDKESALLPCKVMGGINGYAISAYTKAPKACLAFVEFASSYESVLLRNKFLGIAPARSDAAQAVGGLSEMLYQNLEDGTIVVLPSITEVSQIWTPSETFFADVAKDPFRLEEEMKYTTLDQRKAGLEAVDQQIYDAIFILKD